MLRRCWRKMFGNQDADEARARVQKDSVKMEKQVRRIEKNADDLQRRVDSNHITEAVAALWRNK